MTVSRQEVMNKRTPRGGWTKAQLQEWGVGWPPKKGWMRRLTGESAGDDKTRKLYLSKAFPKTEGMRYGVMKRTLEEGLKRAMDSDQ